MQVDDIRQQVAVYDGVLTLGPARGDGSPAIARGDLFLHDAPDDDVPAAYAAAQSRTERRGPR